MANTIFVRARAELRVPDAQGGYRTALWERDAAHPGGEVFVAGLDVVEVAPTGGVLTRLAPNIKDGGTLERLEGSALQAAQEEMELARQDREVQRQIALAQQNADPAERQHVEELRQQNADLERRMAELEKTLADALAAADEDPAHAEVSTSPPPSDNVDAASEAARAAGANDVQTDAAATTDTTTAKSSRAKTS